MIDPRFKKWIVEKHEEIPSRKSFLRVLAHPKVMSELFMITLEMWVFTARLELGDPTIAVPVTEETAKEIIQALQERFAPELAELAGTDKQKE